jgi:hypothetical protein
MDVVHWRSTSLYFSFTRYQLNQPKKNCETFIYPKHTRKCDLLLTSMYCIFTVHYWIDPRYYIDGCDFQFDESPVNYVIYEALLALCRRNVSLACLHKIKSYHMFSQPLVSLVLLAALSSSDKHFNARITRLGLVSL